MKHKISDSTASLNHSPSDSTFPRANLMMGLDGTATLMTMTVMSNLRKIRRKTRRRNHICEPILCNDRVLVVFSCRLINKTDLSNLSIELAWSSSSMHIALISILILIVLLVLYLGFQAVILSFVVHLILCS